MLERSHLQPLVAANRQVGGAIAHSAGDPADHRPTYPACMLPSVWLERAKIRTNCWKPAGLRHVFLPVVIGWREVFR